MPVTVTVDLPTAVANASGGGTISMVAHYFDGGTLLGAVTHTVPYFDTTTDGQVNKALAVQLADPNSPTVAALWDQVKDQRALFTRQRKHAAFMPALKDSIDAKLAKETPA